MHLRGNRNSKTDKIHIRSTIERDTANEEDDGAWTVVVVVVAGDPRGVMGDRGSRPDPRGDGVCAAAGFGAPVVVLAPVPRLPHRPGYEREEDELSNQPGDDDGNDGEDTTGFDS